MYLKMLTVTELEKLNTKRLLGVLKAARAVEHYEKSKRSSWHWCCEMCKEYMGTKEQYKNEVLIPIEHLTNYKKRIKTILSNREHVN